MGIWEMLYILRHPILVILGATGISALITLYRIKTGRL